jgi:plasmid stabilization system protein ParE
MTRRVELTERALREMDRTYGWLVSERSLDYAQRWHDVMSDAFDSLASDVFTWAEAPEAVSSGRDIRQMIVGKKRRAHRVLFEVRGNRVVVLRIRHVSQDYLQPDDL